MPYPVVAETRLDAVPRRFGTRTRRNLEELPRWTPGTALVFQAGGRFVVFDERRHLEGTEDFVLGALAVAVVNMRAEKVTARLDLPSTHPSELFTVLVTFVATVRQADVVVRQGAIDLAQALKEHLLRDPGLATICASKGIEEISEVRARIDARIRAYYSIRAFTQPGIEVSLELIEVPTSKEFEERDRRERTVRIDSDHGQLVSQLEYRNKVLLQDQEKQLAALEAAHDRTLREREAELEHVFESRIAVSDRVRDEERMQWERTQQLLKQEHDKLVREKERVAEEAEAQWAQGFVTAGVPALLAWASARNLINPLQLAEMQRGDEQHTVEQIKDLIIQLNREGEGDMVSFDMQVLVDNLLEKLTGRRPLDSGNGALGPGGLNRDRTALDAPQDNEPDDTPPDDNDFLD